MEITLDLRFGTLTLTNNENVFKGKRNGTIFVNGEKKEVPALKECKFRISPDRFVSSLARLLLNTSLNGEKPQSEPKEDKTTQNEKQTAGNETKSQPRRNVVFRGQEGTSLLFVPLKNVPLIRLSAAKTEDKKIVNATTGILTPAQILSLMAAAGKILRSKDQYIFPLKIASLSYMQGTVNFMGKGGEITSLDEWKKNELLFAITNKFVAGNKYPLNFRHGRIRFGENKEGSFIFRFGREETIITNEDLGIVWSVCSK